MKNITLALDEETYRKARIAAARRDASLSAVRVLGPSVDVPAWL